MRLTLPHGALIYPRYSTEHQGEKTIEEQIMDCSAYCHQQNMPVLGIYPDRAVSGMKSSRPQLDRMMQDFRAGIADTLVIYDQSRLSRDFTDWFAMRKELMSMGVTICSVTQDYVGGDLRDTKVLIQETINALHNQLHVADTSRKVKAALRYRAQIGQHTGGKPPLGYAIGPDKKLRIVEAEAAVVRRIFTEYDSGRSYKQIIDGLNRDGIKTRNGNKFGSNSLHDLMHNARYVGTFTYGAQAYRSDGSRNTHHPDSGDPLILQHPELAIVDPALFDRVQLRMAGNHHTTGGRPPERSYPLKGKVFCGECGSAMSIARSVSKGTAYYYYRCGKKDRTHDCSCPPIRADKLAQIVRDYILGILGDAGIQQRVRELIRAEALRIIGGNSSRREQLQKDLAACEAQISRLVDVLAEHGFSSAVSDRLKALEGRRAELESKLRAMLAAAEVAAIPEAQLEDLFRRIMPTYSTEAICSVVTRVEVSRDQIRIFTAFDPDHDPREPIPTSDGEELTETQGNPSGVPAVYINLLGIVICAGR